MWPLKNFTICFRGLMVIHKVETVEPNFFEVGVVADPDHFLRINTIQNGVLAQTHFFTTPTTATTQPPDITPANRVWTLEVDQPLITGVSAYTQGATGDRIDRKRHRHERDYRWITEFGELFQSIETKIETSRFLPVLKIPQGVFSTRVKSEPLTKMEGGTSMGEFGSIAAVVACDIPMLAGARVRLMRENNPVPLFTFAPDENTIYEFANTPADVPHHHHPAAAADPCSSEHFQRYYSLFRNPDAEPKICFKRMTGAPAPDPATCGAAGAGDIKDPFGGES